MSNYGLPSAGTSYDDEDRLTGFARASGTFTQSWSLTSVGDWNSITTNGTAQNRTHGPTHLRHLCPDCSLSSSSLSPPASGLLPDFDNKLKSADVDNNGSNDVTFQYDALGRRIARQGTSGSFVHVQHDQQTIADYGYGDAPSSPTHRYVVASYIDEPVVRKAAGTSGTIHYLQRNQQYSITAVTTSSGSVAERYAYTAYGQPTILDGSGSILSSSAINNRYTYTGREWDQTLGLYHFRARWMSGIAGRFMGRDPIGFEGSEWDLYEFLMSTPLLGSDSSGRECDIPKEPQVITKPKDKNAVSGMPYGKADLSRFNADGLALPGIRTWCSCEECCNKSFYISDYGVEVEFYIWIDLVALATDSDTYVDENTPSVEGTYGHEQRHVQNMFDAIPGLVANTPAPRNFFNSMDECEKNCERFKEATRRAWSAELVSKGGHDDPSRIPRPRKSYPPIGTMPTFPDPKHPVLPRT